MNAYRTPGIYTERISEQPVPRTRLTSITGLVGLSNRGPMNSPQRIENWGEFESIFDSITSEYDLAPSVYGFFRNGGSVCYVLRVADIQDDLVKPLSTQRQVLNSSATAVIKVVAINEGVWGNDIKLDLTLSRGKIPLSSLVENAHSATDLLTVDSTIDMYPGADITIVNHAGIHSRADYVVSAIISETQVRLSSVTGQAFAKDSVVLGRGVDLNITYSDRNESYENLSFNSDHSRYYPDIVNGDPAVESYVKKMAQGHSILVKLSGQSITNVRPLRGVDTETSTPLAALPSGIDFPDSISHRISYTSGRLRFIGVMTDKIRDQIIELSEQAAYQAAIKDLYANSQIEIFPLTQSGRNPVTPIDVRYFTGKDGDTYFPFVAPTVDGYQGLATLETVEEISLVTILDLSHAISASTIVDHYNIAQQEMLYHCEKMGDRFAIIDSPKSTDTPADPVSLLLTAYMERLVYLPESINGAVYFPWLQLPEINGYKIQRFIPPSGFVAGLYGRTDLYQGVHRSPANEAIEDVVGLQFTVDDTIQARLNTAHVNCIRALPARGIRVWGARTLSGNPEWAYIAVRRIMLVIKKEIKHSLSWATFEPNDNQLQRKLAIALRGYLDGLYRTNILAGSTPEQAYYVKCDNETNTPENLESGLIVAEIGFAPLYPAEFIIVTIKRTSESLEMSAVAAR